MISSKSVKEISKFSAIPGENEALYSSNATFKINGIANDETKSFLECIVKQDLSEIEVIQLEEIHVSGGQEKPKFSKPDQKSGIASKPNKDKQCKNCAKFIANEKFKEHIQECNAMYKKNRVPSTEKNNIPPSTEKNLSSTRRQKKGGGQEKRNVK